MAKKAKKRTTKKTSKKKARYACCDCGTEVIMDCCGIGFRKLICCGKVMKRKRR